MTDIVEKLRDHRHMTQADGLASMLATSNEAATLIEQLRADNVRLREALRDMLALVAEITDSGTNHRIAKARAALQETTDDR